MVALGHWVLDQACGQMSIWRNEGLTLPTIAVNLSFFQLKCEQAAASAAVAHADRSDASVWTALENLLDRLAIANGQRVLSAPVTKV
jgi:EAL domain-containing protein (putative c-di-GMP-specific phosphodiesterase class I)